MQEETVTCVGPCGRQFTLSTELQKKNGTTDKGWLCAVCRWNRSGEKFIGFVTRKV